MKNKMKNKEKTKYETQFVIIFRNRYFGIDFKRKKIKEISFDEAYGRSFFDWDNNICIASDWCKEQYDKARDKSGCGWIGKVVYLAEWEKIK